MIILKVPIIIQQTNQITNEILFGWFKNDVPVSFDAFSYSPASLFDGEITVDGLYAVSREGEVIFNPFGLNLNQPFFRLVGGEYKETKSLSGKITPVLVKRRYPVSMAFPADKKFAGQRKHRMAVGVTRTDGFDIQAFLRDVNGELVETDDDGNFVVNWRHNQTRITSIIAPTGRVIHAGFCLSGNDAALHAYMLKAVRRQWDFVDMDDYIQGVVTDED